MERTFDRAKLPLGPNYFSLLLAPQKPAYPGPYTDRSKNLMGLQAVQTPNPTTIVFHLAQAVRGLQLRGRPSRRRAPVPPNKDTGANYQLHPISTGPYKFQSYQLNKQTDAGAEHLLEGSPPTRTPSSWPARSSSPGT